MIYIFSLIVHIFTLFKKGHMDLPYGEPTGKCCVCGKILEPENPKKEEKKQ